MPERRVRTSTDRARRSGVAGALITALALAAAVGSPETVDAQTLCGTSLGTSPTLSVDRVALSAAATSTVTVSGSGFLTGRYPCGKQLFGGVYVFFGWVAPGGGWGPSHRSSTSSAGQFGVTYSYPGEGGGGDTRDDGTGSVRLISFTSGGTSGSDTDFHMDGAGNWTTTINIRGALYRWSDISTGATNTVDCRRVQCGILTIGAHGKSSATNELFAPISFTDGGPAPTIAPGGVTATPASGSSGASNGTGAAARSNFPSTQSSRPSSSPESNTSESGPEATPDPTVAEGGPGATSIPDAAVTPPDTVGDTTAAGDTTPDREIVAGRIVRIQDFAPSTRGATPSLVVALLVSALLIAPATAAWWILRRRAILKAG